MISIILALALGAPGASITVAHGGNIHTVDPERPHAQAMAWDHSGILLAVGDDESLLSRFPDAKRHDLGGATVVPGFIDAHGHLLNLGRSLMRVDLTETRSVDEVLERLVQFETRLPAGAWLLGRGWDQNDWPGGAFPDRRDLDRLFPDRPVWLTRIDGHAGWANSAAMAEADRDFSGDWQPDGGRILRDADGRATGIFVDRAEALIASAIPPETPDAAVRALDLAVERAASVGLTSVHDAGVSLQDWATYRARRASGAPGLRVYAMADGDAAMLAHLCAQGPHIDPWLTARSVKLYADGALGSRGAALLADYADEPGNRGLMVTDASTLRQVIDGALGCGLQVNTHAIGDRANQVVLNLLEALIPAHPDNPGRHRIEHAQVIAEKDLARFAELGIIASMQPTHATSDMYWAEQRVGPERIRGAYAWQTLVNSGARLALGSDFPVERPEPLLGFHAAVSRRDLAGTPADGWRAEDRLTRDQALRGFTLDAAWAAFQEELIGSLVAGKHADFVVLSDDLMTVPAADIPRIRVLSTWIDGRPTWQAPDEAREN